MRKIAFLLALMMSFIGLQAQEYYINLHQSGQVIYQNNVSGINNMNIQGSPASLYINGASTFPISAFDSITFVLQEPPQPGDAVAISYNGNTVSVTNPYSDQGVEVNANGADVTVYSTMVGVPYFVTGNSSNGSLTIYSNSDFSLTLSYLSLTSNTTAAINLASSVNASLTFEGTNAIADGANSSVNGALYAAGNLTVVGNDILQVTGNAKHGILVDGTLTVNNGEIDILDTDSDGIHGNSSLVINSGTISIPSPGSDALDISGNVSIGNGNVTLGTNAEGARGIKVSGVFTMGDGHLEITCTGSDAKGIKADSLMFINGGTVVIEHSGDMSKGIKTDRDLNITGGDIMIISSGSTVLESVNSQNVPAYCSAIKSDANILIEGGSFHITLPTSNHGGKGISADGTITINGGDFTIETNGDGAAYTVSGSTKDSYTSACLRSDGNMVLNAGTFDLTSHGKGGKGIKVGTSSNAATLTIGTTGGNNDDLTLNVTTTGERITVTSGGGGGWPPGGGGDYANPKGIKCQGNLTINSGVIRVNCTQSQNEGGECIESKAILTINGGDIEAYSVKDDAVNASSQLIINGGVYYAHSDANDGTDSNGTMQLNGGFNISNGARSPEEGFDCDWNQFKITGGTCVGTGGATSSPTTNVCTQPSLKINTMPGYAIQIVRSDGTVICTYQCPNFTGGGGGGPGGGGNSMVMLFTDPQLQTGQTYTVKYNGTISGGTNTHGYYTGNVTYTGGQSTNVTVSSMYTTVNAGGSGW